MLYSISVNGEIHSVDADGDTPVLWVLRDLLNLTGTKFGCGGRLLWSLHDTRRRVPARSCQTASKGG
ncbi:MAG: hypothetical protein Ct9H300mP8_10350 [Gammaproteobacteria bacterium]|nr:MAG: hypothetical protein Ct9H300mP8_10350 [Gammaproteobacteria bacterium]